MAYGNEGQEPGEVVWSSDRDPLWHLINANFSLALIAAGLRIAGKEAASRRRRIIGGLIAGYASIGLVVSVIAGIRAGRRWGWDGGLSDLATEQKAPE